MSDAAVDLAFDLARIHRPSAIVHGNNARDPDNPCLGVDRYLGELNTAEIFAGKAHRAGDAEAAIIVTAVGNCADNPSSGDRPLAETRCRAPGWREGKSVPGRQLVPPEVRQAQEPLPPTKPA